MNRTRLGFLGLILFLGAGFLGPAHLTGIAGAAPAWMGDLSVVQMLDSPNDYTWMGTWDPIYDYDWQRHYNTAYVRVCDHCAVRDCDRCAVRDYARDCDRCAVRAYDSCDRCAAHYYDRSAARDCDLCAARYYDRCDSHPYATDYRCDLFGCGWVR